MDRTAPRGTWDFRRGLAVRTLQFCAVVVLASLILPVNPDVAKTAIGSAFALAGAVIATYLGAATANDHLHRSSSAQPSPPTLPPVKAVDREIS